MATYWEKTRVEVRKAELEEFGMDEVQSKRGWYGYELPGCQWNEKYRPTIDEANWRDWPSIAPNYIIKTAKPGENYTCLLLRRAVLQMPDNEWEDLMDEVKKIKDDYPVLSADTWSQVQMEHQDREWAGYYRQEFREELQLQFEGAFLHLQWGERIQEKFDEMAQTDEFVDEVFFDYLHHHGRGDEWNESKTVTCLLTLTRSWGTLTCRL